MRYSRPAARRDAGMVTAELAAALPVLVLLLAFALSVVSVASGRVRVQDAALEAVRAAARGDTAEAQRLARAAAPGSSLALSTSGDEVTATATRRVHLLASWLPAVTVSAHAVAELEPGEP